MTETSPVPSPIPSPMNEAGLTAAEIDRLMTAFYTDIRADAVLGPIFERAVGGAEGAWPRHEAKIGGFWKNALHIERGAYSGNPMRVHVANAEILPEHFTRWLGLFRAAADRVLAPEKAAAIHARAARIGQSLSFAVSGARQDPDAPPRLF